MRKIICWILGHDIANDPRGRPLSTRLGVCVRCNTIPKRKRQYADLAKKLDATETLSQKLDRQTALNARLRR